MWLLPDGRVVVVLISTGGNTRDKILRPGAVHAGRIGRHRRIFESAILRMGAGRDSRRLAAETGERARALRRNGAERAGPLRSGDSRGGHGAGACTSKARRRWSGAAEFVDQAQLRDLLTAIEEKHRLVQRAERVHRWAGAGARSDRREGNFGTRGKSGADQRAVYGQRLVQGSLGVIGPTRMQDQRAITAVAYVAQLFSETLSRFERLFQEEEQRKTQDGCQYG